MDDQPENIHLMGEILRQDFNVLVANNGVSAIEIAEATPDIKLILLDVMMPEMDGFETAAKLKQGANTSEVPIIFVSALDSAEDIMKGYESGGFDYLTKPIQPDTLIRKIHLVGQMVDERVAMQTEKAAAMEAAMTAMIAGGEQGVLLDFQRRIFMVDTIEGLARQVVASCERYDLNVSVQFRCPDRLVHASHLGPVAPLEQEFLTRVQTAGRLREKGDYFIANFGDITMLVKNMPIEDADKRGRLRDHLAIIMEGAEIRMNGILVEHGVRDIVELSKQDAVEIEKMQHEFKGRVTQILDDLLVDLESSFMSYGLTEEQEDILMEAVQKALKSTMDNFEITYLIDQKLKHLVTKLEEVASKTSASSDDPDEGFGSSESVEFF